MCEVRILMPAVSRICRQVILNLNFLFLYYIAIKVATKQKCPYHLWSRTIFKHSQLVNHFKWTRRPHESFRRLPLSLPVSLVTVFSVTWPTTFCLLSPDPSLYPEMEQVLKSLEEQLQSKPWFSQVLTDQTQRRGAMAQLTCHIQGMMRHCHWLPM